MEGNIDTKTNNIRLWLLAFHIAVILGYGAILIFTSWPIISYVGFKMLPFLAGANILCHLLLGIFLKSNNKEVLEGSLLLPVTYLYLVVDYFGGPEGFLFPLVYLLVIAGFYYKRSFGYVGFGFSIVYVAAHGMILTDNAISNPGVYLTYALSLTLLAIGGYFLNRKIEEIQKENCDLNKMTSKITAEKAQDEAVLTAIADGVYAVDMDRNLVLLNKAGGDLTGWEEKDALGLKCSTVMKLLNQEDASVCEKDCPALAVWNTGEPVFRTDTCFVHKKNKKRIQLSSSYAPIKDFEGKMAGAICVFRDITKEKELERLRNEFVSTASHELRTPITATEGYLSIVTDSGVVKIDDKGREFIGKAKVTLLSMSKLIQNLLAVTKIEEGRLETNITNFSIHDLAVEVIDVFKNRVKEKGITLELVESKDLTLKDKKVIGRSLNVRADREMIREVLNNLVENAIKFTEKGGVTVSFDYDKEFVTVNVEDTGMGMPKEGQKHLFEKFYRVDNTATREVGGTGLGLYITRSIVETFGGRIWVDSAMGKGSQFHFTIPLSLD